MPRAILLALLLLTATPHPASAAYIMRPADWSLFEAIASDDPRRVGEALSIGVNLNEARNSQGESPLMAAAARGNLDIVKNLVEHGADVNMAVPVGLTYTNALARGTGNLRVMMYLIERGASIEGTDQVEPLLLEVTRSSSVLVARYLLLKGANVNGTGPSGGTPLMNAVTCCQNGRGSMEMTRLLIEWGADVNRRDTEGQTALGKATDPHIVRYLVERGADIN
jgi:ankyrin repeat protein